MLSLRLRVFFSLFSSFCSLLLGCTWGPLRSNAPRRCESTGSIWLFVQNAACFGRTYVWDVSYGGEGPPLDDPPRSPPDSSLACNWVSTCASLYRLPLPPLASLHCAQTRFEAWPSSPRFAFQKNCLLYFFLSFFFSSFRPCVPLACFPLSEQPWAAPPLFAIHLSVLSLLFGFLVTVITVRHTAVPRGKIYLKDAQEPLRENGLLDWAV